MYYHGQLDYSDYIFKCDNRPITEVKKLLKKKFNNIKICKIEKLTFDLLKSIISIDNGVTFIEDIYNLEESIDHDLEMKYDDFMGNNCLKDLDEIDSSLYAYILERMEEYCLPDFNCPKSLSLVIDSIDIDEYEYYDYSDDYNIKINLRVTDTELKQIDNIEIKLGFFYNTCNGYYWCFKGDGNETFNKNYSYKCKTTDLDGNKIKKDKLIPKADLIENIKVFLNEIGFGS
ncbi:MAG: hypothetical protein CMF62_00870 [Magnetococcales bacterium]|nr:hypothetical protein [Magnetococcales bacterium]|tara:strand:+ start:2682 stop:3374 length:693 start_codon:yes stop_codon:yes gene_type:complete